MLKLADSTTLKPTCPTNQAASHASSKLLALFDSDTDAPQQQAQSEPQVLNRKVKDIPLNVTLGTLSHCDTLRFDALKHYIPHLTSSREFVTTPKYLGDTVITFNTDTDTLTASDLALGLDKVFRAVAKHLAGITVTYRGGQEFSPQRLSEVLRDKRIQITNPVDGGIGISQANHPDSNIRLNLQVADWYVYNDNYGTSEEKAFVKYFATVIEELKKEYDDVYLVRNERLSSLAIYSFETGERFEPGFLLFLRKHGQHVKQQQIYVEPKGDHLLETDSWKEDFLLSLEQHAIPHKVYVDNSDYRIFGLPFYNQNNRMQEFRKAFQPVTGITIS